ncbi:MAG: DUF4279 domain-containing protein [Cyanosarcina radialis HA8281-LM2]|jgi:hypothetical protein|nr:DUF4279 domain-containing protein [Cyanosarcina radialis HA8281-LM2]
MQLFDSDGNEIPVPQPPPLEELTHMCELGGQFDECYVYIEFKASELDRESITSGLELNPTKAWNTGELHPIGKKSGTMRILDYGKWFLKIDSTGTSVAETIAKIFASASQDLVTWRTLASKYDGHVSLVGYANNWNREFNLDLLTLSLVVERGLSLNIDAYFQDNDELPNETT